MAGDVGGGSGPSNTRSGVIVSLPWVGEKLDLALADPFAKSCWYKLRLCIQVVLLSELLHGLTCCIFIVRLDLANLPQAGKLSVYLDSPR